MKKVTLRVLLLLAVLTLPLVAVSSVNAQPTDITHLIVDTIGEPMDLDPAWSYDTASAELLMNVYETLLWFNKTNMDSYIPVLATSWYGKIIDELSPENLTWKNRWTFTIRDNIYFHTDGVNDIPGEGALMTPADVEYTFERMLVTDASTGPAWMIWEPLTGGYWAGDLDGILTDLGWPVNATTGWNTKMDEAIDHIVESNTTHVWFNLVMPYEPFLQIVAQQWGSIMSQAWCVWHADWPGMQVGDYWCNWTGQATSPLYASDPSAPGPNLDAALGTGPYMLDYWNKGAGGSWSVVRNNNYWRTWTTPFTPEGWGANPAQSWEGYTQIGGHVDRYTSYYIPEWSTRRLRFMGGVSDFCAVPRLYMGQVLGQPGIDCVFPLPLLSCDAAFFTFNVSTSSTRMGVRQNPGVFTELGAPIDMFNELNTRLGFAHLFDFQTYLFAAYLNEAISPVTPIVPGLSYYDPSIGLPESPTLDQRKEYGITGEPAGQDAYDLSLAVSYLQAAWGGDLWANGFTLTVVYNEGNIGRQMAAQMIKDGFDEINALYGTGFHINVASIPWSTYKLEWRARQLPIFVVGWLADFPDAHNFAHPFMHSTGAFSRWQGTLGQTQFPNAEFDSHIEEGISTLVASEREGNYTWLQQEYVDECPSITLTQATGRHFERNWVEGWYYNPIYPGNYVFDLWKAISITIEDVDVFIESSSLNSTVAKIEIGYPAPDNPVMLPFASPIDVTVKRNDTNPNVPTVQVIIGVGLRDGTGREVILDVDLATLNRKGLPGDSYLAQFYDFVQDANAPIMPGNYTIFAIVLVVSSNANDINMANNSFDQATDCSVEYFIGDINVDGTCDMADISMLIDWFMTDPTSPLWDIRGDITPVPGDDSIDMADISWAIDLFMISFDP